MSEYNEVINQEEQLVTEAEAARMLEISKNTLRKWRYKGECPSYLKIGSKVRYTRKSLKEFITKNTVITSI